MKRLMCLAVLVIMPLGMAMVGCGGGLETSKEGEGASTLDADKMMEAGALPEGGPDGGGTPGGAAPEGGTSP